MSFCPIIIWFTSKHRPFFSPNIRAWCNAECVFNTASSPLGVCVANDAHGLLLFTGGKKASQISSHIWLTKLNNPATFFIANATPSSRVIMSSIHFFVYTLSFSSAVRSFPSPFVSCHFPLIALFFHSHFPSLAASQFLIHLPVLNMSHQPGSCVTAMKLF